MFYVTKTYDHNLGMSACFRQPQAKSHCRDPHGYPLAFKLTFGALELNSDHWVIDFGGLKEIKQWLADTFDHKTILAADDPALEDFRALYAKHGFADILTLPFVGCEGFAKFVYDHVDAWLTDNHCLACDIRGLHLVSVEVREHAGNSAIYSGN
jgi:6-pyruvoyltetrahydropterin/6-carboxytetrahydropterin synthase